MIRRGVRLAGVATGLAGVACLVSLYAAGGAPFAGAWAAPARALPWNLDFDADLRAAFARRSGDPETPYAEAFRYLLTSFADRARPEGAAVDQPGAPSVNGRESDALEGFSRLAPVAAAWVAGGRPTHIADLRGRDFDIVGFLHRGLVAGTMKGGPGYWGRVTDMNQRIVEAADIARALWIARDFLLPRLTPEERGRLFAWLRRAGSLRTPDNNWHLYPVIINQVLRSLGGDWDERATEGNFDRFWTFYRGQGWFEDGGNAWAVDWYNAWAIHYELFWLTRIAPGWNADRIADAEREFLKTFPFLIGPKGIPIMGRSICYRLAAPAPLVAAGVGGPGSEEVSPGMARRALDDVWRYFVANGAFSDGVVTQGYCGADLRILDVYSGPSSCLWSLRAVTIAFLAGPRDPFWTAPERPLPVERASYEVSIPALGWRIDGDASTGAIKVTRAASATAVPLEPFSPLRRLASLVFRRPFRPDNHAAKYLRPSYSSANPFCGCAASAEAGK